MFYDLLPYQSLLSITTCSINILSEKAFLRNILNLLFPSVCTMLSVPGHVVDLASTDIERLQMAGIFFPFLVWAPTEALLIFIFMFREVGFGSILGFGILLLGIPVTFS